MIKYSLRCAEGHCFESWFASADAFDRLTASGRVACVVCGTTDVEKALMAPTVGKARSAKQPTEPAPPSAKPLSEPTHPMEAALRAFRKKIEAQSDYVGDRFAQEARAMHSGEQPDRAIHGEATGQEVKGLLEDGVPVAPLPFPVGRKAN